MAFQFLFFVQIEQLHFIVPALKSSIGTTESAQIVSPRPLIFVEFLHQCWRTVPGILGSRFQKRFLFSAQVNRSTIRLFLDVGIFPAPKLATRLSRTIR
jgi:hypothetical protein